MHLENARVSVKPKQTVYLPINIQGNSFIVAGLKPEKPPTTLYYTDRETTTNIVLDREATNNIVLHR